jgi:hypothetical protein
VFYQHSHNQAQIVQIMAPTRSILMFRDIVTQKATKLSLANQCAPLKCPIGNNGTATTEDSDGPGGENGESATEVSGSGSCFPSGEDEPSGNEENQSTGEGVPID